MSKTNMRIRNEKFLDELLILLIKQFLQKGVNYISFYDCMVNLGINKSNFTQHLKRKLPNNQYGIFVTHLKGNLKSKYLMIEYENIKSYLNL